MKDHYADLSARPFFPGLVKYMSSGPVVPMVSIHKRDKMLNWKKNLLISF